MFNKKNKEYKYSIRKYSVGVASVAVAACLFLGGAAHAQEETEGRVPVPPGTVETETRTVDYVTMESNVATETAESTETTPTPVPAAPMPAPQSGNITTNGGHSGTTIDWGDNKHEDYEVLKPEEVLKDLEGGKLTPENLDKYRKGLKESLEQTDLSEETKRKYREQIDKETDAEKLQLIENNFQEEQRKLSENLERNRGNQEKSLKEDFLDNLKSELDFQKKHIEEMFSKKAITVEEKETALQKLEEIKKEAEEKSKGRDRNTLASLTDEVIRKIAEIKLEKKSSAEKEIINYADKRLTDEIRNHVSEMKKDEELERKYPGFSKFRENLRTTIKESLKLLAEVTTDEEVGNVVNVSKRKIDRVTAASDTTLSKLKDELSDEIEKINILLKGEPQDLQRVNSEGYEIYKKLKEEVLKDIEDAKLLLSPVEDKEDEIIFQKTLLEQNYEVLKEKIEKLKEVVKPKREFQALIEKGNQEAENLKEILSKVNTYPETPLTEEYNVQREIWNQGKDIAPKKIEDFKNVAVKSEVTKKELDAAIEDLLYYQIHAQIETRTREIAEYRNKYPNNQELNAEFNKNIKQEKNNNYATLEGIQLNNYYKNDFSPSYERIQKIVKDLEEKKSSEDKMQGDQAPAPAEKGSNQDVDSLKKSVDDKLKKLKWETETVPSGIKLEGDALPEYNKKKDESKKIIRETEELLKKKEVSAEELAKKLEEVNNAISELKEAEDKLPRVSNGKKEMEDRSTPQSPKVTIPAETPKLPEAQVQQKDEEKTSEDREAKAPEVKEESKKTGKELAPKPEAKEESKDMSKDEAKVEEKTPEEPASKEEPKKEQPKDNANGVEKATSPVAPANQDDNKPQTPKQPEMKQEPKEMDKKPTEKDAPKATLETKEFKFNGIKVELNKDVDANELSANKVEDEKLIEKVKKELSVDNVRIFDLNLLKDGKVTNPNVERTVRIALVDGENNARIYHVKEDNKLEEITSTIEENEIVFKTNHFSMYAVVSKKDNTTAGKEKQPEMDKEKVKETDKKTSEMASASSKDGKALPNTSSANNGIIAGVVGLILGLLALVRRVCVK